jgi:hypothetical protein
LRNLEKNRLKSPKYPQKSYTSLRAASFSVIQIRETRIFKRQLASKAARFCEKLSKI